MAIAACNRINQSTYADSAADAYMRVDNFVSKYVIEVIQSLIFLPWELGNDMYWEFKSLHYVVEDFWDPLKDRVQHYKKFKPYNTFPRVDDPDFLTSVQFQKLRMLCPLFQEKIQANQWRESFDLSGGTCYGESLTAMKHHQLFDVQSGVQTQGIDYKEMQREATFLQLLHQIHLIYKGELGNKKEFQKKGIKIEDVVDPTGSFDEAKAFKTLRATNYSRAEARLYCTPNLVKILRLSTSEHERCIERIEAVLERTVIDGHSCPLKQRWFKASTQEVAEASVREFLSQQKGSLVFIGAGGSCGHGMFIKIAQGWCITFDPATHCTFSTPHTPEGISETIRLMNRIVMPFSGRGKLSYRIDYPA